MSRQSAWLSSVTSGRISHPVPTPPVGDPEPPGACGVTVARATGELPAIVAGPQAERSDAPGPLVADDVILIDELARILRCSVWTIRRCIRDAQGREPWQLPPRMLRLNKTHRWSRVMVEAWLAHNPHASKLRGTR